MSGKTTHIVAQKEKEEKDKSIEEQNETVKREVEELRKQMRNRKDGVEIVATLHSGKSLTVKGLELLRKLADKNVTLAPLRRESKVGPHTAGARTDLIVIVMNRLVHLGGAEKKEIRMR